MKLKIYRGSLRCQKPQDYVLLSDLDTKFEEIKNSKEYGDFRSVVRGLLIIERE